MKTEAQRAAEWAAFDKGQNDWRDNRPRNNPYPAVSAYHYLYEQGYDAESEIHHK